MLGRFLGWISTISRGFLFVFLILYVPGNNFSVMLGQVFLGWTCTNRRIKCLAQGHDAVPPIQLEPTTHRSWFKHPTTELPISKGLKCLALGHSDNAHSSNINPSISSHPLYHWATGLHITNDYRVPKEIQNHNSMIFPWFSMINNLISMTIKCTASNLPF